MESKGENKANDFISTTVYMNNAQIQRKALKTKMEQRNCMLKTLKR